MLKFLGVPRIPENYQFPADVTLEEVTQTNVDALVGYEMGLCHTHVGVSRDLWVCEGVTGYIALHGARVCGAIAMWPLTDPDGTHFYRISQYYADEYSIAKALMVHAIRSKPPNTQHKWYIVNQNVHSVKTLVGEFGMAGNQLAGNASHIVRLYTMSKTAGVAMDKVYSAYSDLV